jgi:hypothetical protein
VATDLESGPVTTEPEREIQRLTNWLQSQRERDPESDQVTTDPESD